MRILMLAPEPFYMVRGSPIAIDVLLQALSEGDDDIDVVTYHVGQDVEYRNVTLHRTRAIPFIHNIQPRLSWQKLLCDILLFFKALHLARTKRHHVVHAVEESVFLALLLKWLLGIPYVYDMDSSLSQQITEQFPWLSPTKPVLNAFEKLAIRNAQAVVAVCDALASYAEEFGANRVVVLPDISLLDGECRDTSSDLHTELGLKGLILMYVGNLQAYQGIGLLLESTRLAFEKASDADLVIIGGDAADISKYQAQSRDLGIDKRVHFLGPRSLEDLANYLSQADILVSPRITGENTPMKIYSYLGSGKPILATDLPTHTQVLDNTVARLVDPTPSAFAEGELQLIEDGTLRLRLGEAGKKLAVDEYSFDAFRRKCDGLFDWLAVTLCEGQEEQLAAGAPLAQTREPDDGMRVPTRPAPECLSISTVNQHASPHHSKSSV